MKQRVTESVPFGHEHPEYDFPNETAWNVVVVTWGSILIVLGALAAAYLY